MWNVPSNIALADPTFYRKGQIDMLLGAEEFYNIIMGEQMHLGPGKASLRQTKLGWIITGRVDINNPEVSINHAVSQVDHIDIDSLLEKFWKIEECPKQPIRSQEEIACENLFKETTIRNEDGRFVVNLPLKESSDQLGDAKETARQRFLSLEKRLSKNPLLKEQYKGFIKEYVQLDHAEIVNAEEQGSKLQYYLPHHCVINPHSSSTKLRVVFDGSCPTSSGTSLNDVLMVGPKTQEDLLAIILRFRTHKIVVTADVTKMYRQVKVAEHHTDLQRIVWRDSPEDPLQTLRLKTVTYGTASAAYQATRCLNQLSEENQERYPLGAQAVGRDFYVDDLLTGHDSMEEAQVLIQQVICILSQGKCELHKWCTNEPSLLEKLPPSSKESSFIVNSDNDKIVKTLGLWWNAHTDSFGFLLKLQPCEIATKRILLATISRIFDPMGLLGPVVLKGKLLMQRLWLSKVTWDEPLPPALSEEWHLFQRSLLALEEIKFPRCVKNFPTPIIEIHGFCDASEDAYGAAVYVRCANANHEVVVHLLASKSRVSPIKKLTVPRLELCGALLLSRLLTSCIEALSLNVIDCTLWTDSQIVLAWIAQPASKWKTFVGHRVSEIQELTSKYQWRFIRSQDNPADQLSRGMNAKDFCQSTNWWQGPPWLSQPHEAWPDQNAIKIDVDPPEARALLVSAIEPEAPVIEWERFSNLNRLLNTVSYVLRFRASKGRPHGSGIITANERSIALGKCLELVQRKEFSCEMHQLKEGKGVQPKSKIRTLNPFVDAEGLVRVGGRLRYAQVEFEQKHPILLPSRCRLAELIATRLHLDNCHAGPQLLLATMRQRFWPLSGRNLVRRVVHKCIICYRHNPKPALQIMGELPFPRVNQARPFTNSGVDFCGPIMVRPCRRRGVKCNKAYIAIFICLATRAVHIELVSDLSSESFIGALKRFINRRGKALNLYSDNGTNFVGAKRKLQEMFIKVSGEDRVREYISHEGVT